MVGSLDSPWLIFFHGESGKQDEGGGLCPAAYAVFKWLNNVNFISGEKWLKLVFTSC